MILYLDTSSLIKLYVEEEGSRAVRDKIDQSVLAATSVVAYAESRAALARLRREGGLTRAEYGRAKADLEQDWPRLLTLEVKESVYRRAADLAEIHRLRGFDSLHLASYASLCDETPPRSVEFLSFDKPLNRAAQREARRRARQGD